MMSNAVLIVDDEQRILHSLERLLRRDGHEVHLADNGPAALEILASTEIAVLICDQRMPGMTGSEVLAKAYALRPDTVRITLTGYTDLNAAQSSINEGHVSHFLLKPWDDELLRSVVRDSVEAHRLLHENRRLEALTRKQKDELEAWNQRLEQQVKQRTEQLHARNESLLHLQRRAEQSLRDTVGVLAGTLEAHNPNLGIHSKRVAQLARQIASKLDVDDRELRDIEFAAHLHDLGKLSRVADKEATKPTQSERHAGAGYAILSKVSGFETVANALRHQHERFDGSGHPDGLKKDEIPLAARIIAVANAYDKVVFSTKDPTDVSHEAGHKMLHEQRGVGLDPHLVDQLLQYLEEIGAAADIDAEVELSPKKIRVDMTLSRPIYNHDGLLLLKEGTRLTDGLIERIRKQSRIDPLLSSVFVFCTSGSTELSRSASISGTSDDPSTVLMSADHEMEQREADDPGVVPDDEPPANQDATVVVPTLEEPKATRSAPPLESGSKGRVLVVDDSVLVCNALKREFRSAGIHTTATDSGWNAINLVEQGQFDAALIDLMMPAMRGDDLIRRLQQCAPALPCFVLTGNATKEAVVALSAEPNFAGILTKPWDHDRLITALETAIAKSQPQLARGPA